MIKDEKGYTLVEITVVLLLIFLVATAGYSVYMRVVADTYALQKIGEDMAKIFDYYNQRDCSSFVPIGLPDKNPFGNNYIVTCGNNRLTIITTTIPASVSKTFLPSYKNMNCYMNGNNLVCFRLWAIADDGGFEKKNFYLQ